MTAPAPRLPVRQLCPLQCGAGGQGHRQPDQQELAKTCDRICPSAGVGHADRPRYIVPQTKERFRTELLADYWRQRWLLRRLEKPGILEEVAKHTVVYPIRHGAQVQLPRERDETLSLWDVMS